MKQTAIDNSYINKHVKYIDTRIGIISEYLYFLNKSTPESLITIEKIVDFLIAENLLIEEIPEQILDAVRDLRKILTRWAVEADGDIIGYIYQNLDKLTNKKSKGQYFTPGAIVEEIVEKAIPGNTDLENVKIIDPACGSGQFLISAFKRLLKLHAEKGSSMQEASAYIVLNNLYGADIDPLAVKIARYNLQKISSVKLKKNIKVYKTNTLLLDEMNFSDQVVLNKKFDIVIGNPPWGSKLTNQQKSYFRKHYISAKSGINTFTLFIERSLEMLKEKGRLAFLIPEAYLNIKAHRNSRIQVLEETKIEEIKIWGDQFKNVYAPSVSICCEKTKNEKVKSENVVNIIDGKSREMGIAKLIPQNYYYKTFENIFNINYSKKAVNIISKINNLDNLYLNKNARFFLGIVTGNNPKYLYNKYAKDHPDKIIIGKDLTPYKINYSGKHFKYDTKELQQVAPQELYKVKNKILYKFIGKKLSFALDKEGLYTLNNVNGFIPEFDTYTPEALVAILNSSVMQYYYEKNFFTLKVLKGNLEKLPLKEMKTQVKNQLTSLSKKAMNSGTEFELKQCKDNIDDLLFYEYGLKDKEAYSLWEETQTTKRQAIIPGF